jgi:hypothetical protein
MVNYCCLIRLLVIDDWNNTLPLDNPVDEKAQEAEEVARNFNSRTLFQISKELEGKQLTAWGR